MNCFANWERIDVSEQPTARWGHSSYIYRDNIYIYGGFSGNASQAYIGDVDSINITTKGHQRYPIDDIPARSNSASIGIGHNFLIHGGRANKQTFADLLCWDCTQKKFIKLNEENASDGSPGNRAHHCCCKFKGKYILYYGGDDMNYNETKVSSRETFYTSTYLLHTNHLNEHKVIWEKANVYVKNPSDIDIYPKPRRFHTMIEHKPTGSIILYGGIPCSTQSAIPCNDIWIFTPLSKPYHGSWIRPKKIKGNIPAGRWGHTISYISSDKTITDSFIIFGGYTNTSVNVIYILTIEKYPKIEGDNPFDYVIEWSIANTSKIIPQPRRRHTICQDKSNNYIIFNLFLKFLFSLILLSFYIFGGYSTVFYNDLYKLEININLDENLSVLLDKCNAKSLHPILLEKGITYNQLKYFTDEDYEKNNIPLGVKRQIQGEFNFISTINFAKPTMTPEECLAVQRLITERYNSDSINNAMDILISENKEFSYENLINSIDQGRKSMVEDIKKKEMMYQELVKKNDELVKVKERKMKESKSENTCCICMERTPDVIVLPCGHFCLCHQCIELIEKKKKCPFCSKKYTELVEMSE